MANESKNRTRNGRRGARQTRDLRRLSQAGFSVAFTYWSSQSQADDVSKLNRAKVGSGLISPTRSRHRSNQQITRSSRRAGQQRLRFPSRKTRGHEHRSNSAIECDSSGIAPAALPEIRIDAARLRGHVVNMIDLLVERPWPEYLRIARVRRLREPDTRPGARIGPEVTVNGIAPGVVDWPKDTPDAEKENSSAVPLGAPVLLGMWRISYFLCTEGSYITGQIIRLDGGRSIT